MTSPRVQILIESYYPVSGGMESQALTLSAGLSGLGVPHRILTRRISEEMKSSEEVSGVTVTRIGPIGRSGRWMLAMKALPWLVLHRKEYDVVFVPGFRTLGVAAVIAGKITGKPCVLKADSRGELSGAFFRAGLIKKGLSPDCGIVSLFLALWRRILRSADAFVSLSEEMSAEFRECGLPSARIRTIPNAVDTVRFKPVLPAEKARVRESLGVPEGKTVFLYTGRLVSYKGLPVLLEAWRRSVCGHPDRLLLLVGGGGHDQHNCEAQLRGFVMESGLEDSVRFTGESTSVHRYLQSADIFVFPTEEEAFGLSLVEAMACGLAVISTRVGGIADFLCDGVNGIEVAPGAVDGIVEAMNRLEADTDLRAVLGENASATVLERYAVSAVSRAYADLFRGVNAQKLT
jgi:glycosyltransferase involved in cell wall biosynthesis